MGNQTSKTKLQKVVLKEKEPIHLDYKILSVPEGGPEKEASPIPNNDSVLTAANSGCNRTICIVGSGLAGAMMAILLAKLGFNVCIYEKRPEVVDETSQAGSADEKVYGTSKSAQKRSINLALSYRGMIALKEIDMLDEALVNAIRMPCRVIHSIEGKKITKQPYGKEDEALYSVGRQFINSLLLERIKKLGIKIYFQHAFIKSDKDGNCFFMNDATKEELHVKYDLVIGSDGAYSSVRTSLLTQGRINFSRQYIAHGYKELNIPPTTGNDFALDHHQGLHIWPRGNFMLIALPNPDRSFTATLFAPYEGRDGFDSIDATSKAAVEEHFRRYFPDVFPIIQPTLFEDYRENPVGSLVTIRTCPWNHGRTVLIGDAAHAVVPFFGQGMNAAFEDALILYEIIRDTMSFCHPRDPTTTTTTTTTASVSPRICVVDNNKKSDSGKGKHVNGDKEKEKEMDVVRESEAGDEVGASDTSSLESRQSTDSYHSGQWPPPLVSTGKYTCSTASSTASDDGPFDYVIPSPVSLSASTTGGADSSLSTSSSQNFNFTLNEPSSTFPRPGPSPHLHPSTASLTPIPKGGEEGKRGGAGEVFSKEQLQAVDLVGCANEFARLRTPAANGLSDLCLEHYTDMASSTSSSFYLFRKRVELLMTTLLPRYFTPLYSMVAFSNIPYHDAILKSKQQDAMLNQLAIGLATIATAAVAAGGLAGVMFLKRQGLPNLMK